MKKVVVSLLLVYAMQVKAVFWNKTEVEVSRNSQKSITYNPDSKKLKAISTFGQNGGVALVWCMKRESGTCHVIMSRYKANRFEDQIKGLEKVRDAVLHTSSKAQSYKVLEDSDPIIRSWLCYYFPKNHKRDLKQCFFELEEIAKNTQVYAQEYGNRNSKKFAQLRTQCSKNQLAIIFLTMKGERICETYSLDPVKDKDEEVCHRL